MSLTKHTCTPACQWPSTRSVEHLRARSQIKWFYEKDRLADLRSCFSKNKWWKHLLRLASARSAGWSLVHSFADRQVRTGNFRWSKWLRDRLSWTRAHRHMLARKCWTIQLCSRFGNRAGATAGSVGFGFRAHKAQQTFHVLFCWAANRVRFCSCTLSSGSSSSSWSSLASSPSYRAHQMRKKDEQHIISIRQRSIAGSSNHALELITQ